MLGEHCGANHADRHVVRIAQEFPSRIGGGVVVVCWRVEDALIERAEVALEGRPAPGRGFPLLQKALTRLP